MKVFCLVYCGHWETIDLLFVLFSLLRISSFSHWGSSSFLLVLCLCLFYWFSWNLLNVSILLWNTFNFRSLFNWYQVLPCFFLFLQWLHNDLYLSVTVEDFICQPYSHLFSANKTSVVSYTLYVKSSLLLCTAHLLPLPPCVQFFLFCVQYQTFCIVQFF